MKKYFYLLLLLPLQTTYIAFAQGTAPGILWQKTIGGSKADVLTAMCIGSDKSIVLCGYSNSGVSGNKSAASFGGYDYWVVKLDSNGTIRWNKTYGGSDDDFAAAITATSDGGYLVGGSSVSNISGSKTSSSFGQSFDYWVLKLDANGNIIWDKTMGGLSTEKLTSLAELPGNVYVVGGYAYSNNNGAKTLKNLGPENNADFWTILANSDGSLKSQYVFGATSHDVMTCVSPAGVSGFYAAGYSYSDVLAGGKSQNAIGNNDYWIMRSNMNGGYEFQGTFGGKLSDYLTCMQALPDSSLIFGGYSNSDPGNSKSGAFLGIADYWLLKLKRAGTKQWDKTYGGTGGDFMTSVRQTSDKGFILGGYSNSNVGNTKTTNSKGGYDYWIVKTDSLGRVQWDKTIGGSRDDTLIGIYEIAPNEYIAAGTSASPKSGDKTAGVVGSSGLTDYWVMRLGTSSMAKPSASNIVKASQEYQKYDLQVMPDPVKDVLTIKYSAATSKVNFTIYDAGGKAVLHSALSAGAMSNMHNFNIAHLPDGSYFAVLYAGTTKLTKAFTKE